MSVEFHVDGFHFTRGKRRGITRLVTSVCGRRKVNQSVSCPDVERYINGQKVLAMNKQQCTRRLKVKITADDLSS